MLDLLKRSDAEFFDGRGGTAKPRFKPGHWDSISIAGLLQEAALGFPSSKGVGSAGKAALAAFQHAKLHSKNFPKGFQSVMYEAIVNVLYPDYIPKLLQKRLKTLDPAVSFPMDLNFSSLRAVFMTYPEYIIFTIIRSWANGWTTSHRMPEPALLPCILGCPGEIDSLSHYLRCDRLWRALKVASRRCSLALPSPFFSAPILAKLAVLNTEKTSVVMLCALSHAYHVIKNNFLEKMLGGFAADAAAVTNDVLASAVLRVLSMLLVGASLPSATDPFGA